MAGTERGTSLSDILGGGGSPPEQSPETQALESILSEINSTENPSMDPTQFGSMPPQPINTQLAGSMGIGPIPQIGLSPEQEQLIAKLVQQGEQKTFFTKKLVEEFKQPALAAGLALVMNSSLVTKFMANYIPGMLSDGKETMVSLFIRFVTIVILFYLLNKFI